MMEVFIGNIPAEAKLIDLHNILGDYVMHSDFTTHEGKDCDHRKYHFVVVDAKDKPQMSELIERLNGFEFYGQKLDVRRYMHRDLEKQKCWQGRDRRINEQMNLL